MIQKEKEESNEEKKEEDSIFGKLPLNSVLVKIKTALVVFLLVVFFNLNPIDDFLRLKQFSLFYDIKEDKSTFLFAFVKAIFISVFYYLITYLLT